MSPSNFLVPRVIKHVKAASIYWRKEFDMWSEHYKNVDSGTKQGTYGEVYIFNLNEVTKGACPRARIRSFGLGSQIAFNQVVKLMIDGLTKCFLQSNETGQLSSVASCPAV